MRAEPRPTGLNPSRRSAANLCVRNKEMGSSPEEPDQSPDSVQIVVSSQQFKWLTKQCDFLGITKQQLIADALEEWLCRNRTATIVPDPSAVMRRALDEFIQRHREEFLPTAGRDWC
jgi:hypothetical protein